MLYSIGHGARPLAVFLSLLARHDIRAVVDVRSRPGSRFHPQYNAKALEAALAAAGVGYRFLGESLGGRPVDPALLDDEGKPDYGKMAAESGFRAGVKALLSIDAESGRAAMLCSERDPRTCHRSRLIGAALLPEGVDAVHIDVDGSLVLQSQLGEAGGLFLAG